MTPMRLLSSDYPPDRVEDFKIRRLHSFSCHQPATEDKSMTQP
jgi:hypothetical protein